MSCQRFHVFELITMNTKGKGAGTPMLALKAMTGVFLSMPEDWLLWGLLSRYHWCHWGPPMTHFWRPNPQSHNY